MTLFLALQDEIKPGTDLAQPLADIGVSTWLYLGSASAWRIAVERSSLGQLTRRSTAAEIQRAAAALRRPFIDALGQLSLLNDSLEWWASDLWEQALLGRLCSLAVMRHLIEDGLDRCLVVCSTSGLLEEVTDAAAAAGVPVMRLGLANASRRQTLQRRAVGLVRRRVVGRALERWADQAPASLRGLPGRFWPRARLVIEGSPAHRRSVLERLGASVQPFAGENTAVLFTWVDERSVAPDGTYSDRHWQWLAAALRKRDLRVAFIPVFMHSRLPDDLPERLLATGEHLIFPELLVDADVFRACKKQAYSFVPEIPADFEVEGVPLARLAREWHDEHRFAHARNLWYAPLVEGLARAGVRPRFLIHPYQGEEWERVVAFATRHHLPETRVVGYDNLNMSRLGLNLYPARAELGRRPLPHRIVTMGPAFRDVLVKEGIPPDIVRVGCGIRNAELWNEASRSRRVRDPERAVVLVAAPHGLDPSAELADKAVKAFGGDTRYEVVIKWHPSLPARTLERLSAEVQRYDNVVCSESKIGDLLLEADMLLYTGTSVVYDALAFGVPAVFVQSETDLDFDKLEPFADLRWTARTPEELRAAARSLTSLKPDKRDAWRVRAQEAVRSALAPVGEAGVEAVLD
jgi:hypothetical protein